MKRTIIDNCFYIELIFFFCPSGNLGASPTKWKFRYSTQTTGNIQREEGINLLKLNAISMWKKTCPESSAHKEKVPIGNNSAVFCQQKMKTLKF